MNPLDVNAEFAWHFGLVIALAFLIGIEFHQYQRAERQGLGFGTTRTLTLVGTAGFLLYVLDGSGILYALGFGTLALWLALYYRARLKENYASLIAPLTCVLVYLLGPLMQNAPPWFLIAYAVLIVFFLNAKPRIRAFSDMLPDVEVATFVKFAVMAGIVLPLLPDRQIAPFIPVTFQQTWEAVVAVSGISYLSYLAQTYLFKSKSTLVAGLLGGLYSSTATTLLLGHRARETPGNGLTSPALILATAMMYARLLVLALLLAPASLVRLAPPFAAAILLSLAAAFLMSRMHRGTADGPAPALDRHPLEIPVALLFAALFVVFTTVTQFVVSRYSDAGLQAMAFAIGFTEIDPFVLSVLTGQTGISLHAAVDAVVIATASNNLLKAGFAVLMARNRSVLPACGWLLFLAVASFVYVIA